MPYTAIAVALTGATDDATTLEAACQLARLSACPLSVLALTRTEAPVYAAAGFGGGLLAADVWRVVDERGREATQRIVALTDAARTEHQMTRTATGAPGLKVISGSPSPWIALQHELPLADLVVMGQSGARDDGPWTGVLADILMGARTPVLVVRDEHSLVGAPAVVAWDGSFEAGRAIRAALPLLRAARSVTVLQRPDDLESGREGAADPTRVVSFLTEAGCGPVTVRLVDGAATGDCLLEAAAQIGARLLVAGAFGHARLREAVLGGATRSFLAAEDGPSLLLCH